MNSLYARISQALIDLLRGRKSKIEPAPHGTDPLFLLLKIGSELVGFASLNGRPEAGYLKSFENFRNLYLVKSESWAELDLILVLCKEEDSKATDELCDNIERDTYFCRKLVIDLSHNLNTELGRIPAIPLRYNEIEAIVGMKKPVSAQTFLSGHGVKSDLARYLAVPYSRGTESIVGDCLGGSFGSPIWHNTIKDEFISEYYRNRSAVKLRELEINNFRAYRGCHKFTLDADIIVLYGSNGLGKTSFFDAIDFICTGNVARFEIRPVGRDPDRLSRILKHLDASTDESIIRLKAMKNNHEITVERSVSDRNTPVLNGASTTRTQALLELTGLTEEPPDLRIDNFVRLFRASHVFGQEYQAFTSGLRNESRLPEDTVSRMLAFQDYVEAINKSEKVRDELQKRARNNNSQTADLKERLRSIEDDIRKLSESAEILREPKMTGILVEEIVKKVEGAVQSSIEIPAEIDQKIVRQWRGLLEAKINSVRGERKNIQDLEAKYPNYEARRKELGQDQDQLAKLKNKLKTIVEQLQTKQGQLRKLNEHFQGLLTKERTLRSTADNIDWLLRTKENHDKLNTQLKNGNEKYTEIKNKSNELQLKVLKTEADLKNTQELLDGNESQLKALKGLLKELDDFDISLGDWENLTTQGKELNKHMEETNNKLRRGKDELKNLEQEQNAQNTMLEKYRNNVETLQESRSELESLLNKLEGYIIDAACPVCGTSHKSKEELLRKLKGQIGIQPPTLQEALKSYKAQKTKSEETKNAIAKKNLDIRSLEDEIQAIKGQTLKLTNQQDVYTTKARSLGLPESSPGMRKALLARKNQANEKISEVQPKIESLKLELIELRQQLAILQKQHSEYHENLEALTLKHQHYISEIDRISEEAINRQISLDTSIENARRELESIKNELKMTQKEVKSCQGELNGFEQEVNSIEQSKRSIEIETNNIEEKMNAANQYIEEIEYLKKDQDFGPDTQVEEIAKAGEERTNQLLSFEKLLDEVIGFEIALDAAETSASLARLQQETASTETKLALLESESENLRNWLSYFNLICQELGTIQNEALRIYTERYGPLASIIQRRLRSVYGFGELHLSPEKGGIVVSVERRSKQNVFPNDYFSESQLQIVMLSIFLSAALTQTWSCFAPILLDDPVEHFDDLNSYSFLDLIKGLVTEPGGGQQFIISTCETRLFQLIRQKFAKLDAKVIYYEFKSIGEEGPVVSRLQ